MAGLFEGRTVVVTGGTGALGGAVLARLVADGARCHVPTAKAAMPEDFALAKHPRVVVAPGVDLGDIASVD
ncbi:short-chain dehydrogenase, partial [Mesorhizobium sp. ZMM04-4]